VPTPPRRTCSMRTLRTARTGKGNVRRLNEGVSGQLVVLFVMSTIWGKNRDGLFPVRYVRESDFN